MSPSPPTLTAFYDLDVSPISYDFAIFLALAKIERNRAGRDAVHIVIVPAAEGQFRDDDVEYDAANKRWRLHNILLPLCAAAPSPVSISFCRDRDEATRIEAILDMDSPRFPEGYATNAPTPGFMWSHVASASARGTTCRTMHVPKASAQPISSALFLPSSILATNL